MEEPVLLDHQTLSPPRTLILLPSCSRDTQPGILVPAGGARALGTGEGIRDIGVALGTANIAHSRWLANMQHSPSLAVPLIRADVEDANLGVSLQTVPLLGGKTDYRIRLRGLGRSRLRDSCVDLLVLWQ